MSRPPTDSSPALARFLRERRRDLGWTLRDVETRASELGKTLPFSTLARIEQGRVDPGVKRLHLLLKLYNLPMQMAGDLLDLEEMADERPATRDPDALYRDGIALWKKGESRKAIAHLLALREMTPEGAASRRLRQKALLAFAVAANSLGKPTVSLSIVEDLLREGPEPSLLVTLLIQAGNTWIDLGSPVAALAFLGQARSSVNAGDWLDRARIHHGGARARIAQGDHVAAAIELDRAVEHYRKAKDAFGEGLALGTRIRVEREAGKLEDALKAARRAKEHARRHGFERLRMLRLIDEGELLVASGESDAGLAVLNEAQAAAIASGDQGAQFYAHYYLWKVYLALGDPSRAEVEWNAARYFVRFVEETSEEAAETRGTTSPPQGATMIMTRRLLATLLLGAGIALVPCPARAIDPPDSEVNPLTGDIESVDSAWNGSDWDVRHVIDPGQGVPGLVEILSDSSLDDLGSRLCIREDGQPAIVWWREDVVDEVIVRWRDPVLDVWGSARRVSEDGEPSRRPEITTDGTSYWVAYEVDATGGDSGIVVKAIRDDVEPFPTRTLLATTSFAGDVDVMVHFEAGSLWVTWLDSDSEVGWSEHDAVADAWSPPAYEPYAADDVPSARDRIRDQVLEP